MGSNTSNSPRYLILPINSDFESGWIAGQMTWLLEQNYLHLPAIHTRSRIQHLKRLTYEKPITLVGQFVRAYEQKGNHYAELDGSMYSGNELCTQMKHTTIFKIKPKL